MTSSYSLWGLGGGKSYVIAELLLLRWLHLLTICGTDGDQSCPGHFLYQLHSKW